MTLLNRFRGLLEGFLIVVSLLLMAVLAVIVIAAVFFRYSGASFTWYDEVASIVLAWLTYYGAALAALRRAHLGFPNLVALLPPALRLVALLISEAVVFVFFIVMAKFGYEAIILLHGDALVSLPWVKVEVVMSVIPIGAVLFILAELTTLPEKIREAWYGMPPAEIEHLTEVTKP
jgi:TRAP-type C4-dicarboxylate transport system permease small subunit